MDDVRLSARELRALHELEIILRRQNRHLDRRMRTRPRGPARTRRGPGRCTRTLTALSASLMVLTLRSGRWTRQATALAFASVWLLARATTPRRARG